MNDIEFHPLQPFVPSKSRVLMLGSFPPKRDRWSIDFYYPNFQNDMWRIFGIIYFDDKNIFINPDKKTFNKERITNFLTEKHIAISDIALSVVRHKDNASDNFLEIIEQQDIASLLETIPDCKSVITTGQKANEAFAKMMNIETPKMGEFSEFMLNERQIEIYRIPSSSRAYPLKLERKAEIYKNMLLQLSMISK